MNLFTKTKLTIDEMTLELINNLGTNQLCFILSARCNGKVWVKKQTRFYIDSVKPAMKLKKAEFNKLPKKWVECTPTGINYSDNCDLLFRQHMNSIIKTLYTEAIVNKNSMNILISIK